MCGVQRCTLLVSLYMLLPNTVSAMPNLFFSLVNFILSSDGCSIISIACCPYPQVTNNCITSVLNSLHPLACTTVLSNQPALSKCSPCGDPTKCRMLAVFCGSPLAITTSGVSKLSSSHTLIPLFKESWLVPTNRYTITSIAIRLTALSWSRAGRSHLSQDLVWLMSCFVEGSPMYRILWNFFYLFKITTFAFMWYSISYLSYFALMCLLYFLRYFVFMLYFCIMLYFVFVILNCFYYFIFYIYVLFFVLFCILYLRYFLFFILYLCYFVIMFFVLCCTLYFVFVSFCFVFMLFCILYLCYNFLLCFILYLCYFVIMFFVLCRTLYFAFVSFCFVFMLFCILYLYYNFCVMFYFVFMLFFILYSCYFVFLFCVCFILYFVFMLLFLCYIVFCVYVIFYF